MSDWMHDVGKVMEPDLSDFKAYWDKAEQQGFLDYSDFKSNNKQIFNSIFKPHLTVLESFEIHKELNSLFFNAETGKMKEEVRHRLFKIAYLLIESMIENDIPLSISDILLIGSNAAYNYTEYSDLDLHILVDKSVVEDQELLTNLYNYIKADFNNKYDISIYGHDVEVYLQGLDEENAAAGVYSILKDEWVKFPEQPEEERSITIEDKEIFKNWENRYNNLLDHEIDTFVQDLYKLRKSSLKTEGEFSDGNLVFKEFRNRGYLQDLKDRKNKIKSNELTLEGVMADEKFKIDELPGLRGNAYSASKYLLRDIKATNEKCEFTSKTLAEGIDLTFEDAEKGGIIVFSTDVNSVELSSNKIVNWLKQKITTLGNRITATKKVDKIVGGKYNAVGWTVGKYLSGRYTAKNGNFFGENSISVEIIGIDESTLIAIAEDLCEEFKQETVLVKSYIDGGKIFLVSANK